MENAAGQVMTVRGESLGGGKVRIVRINGVEVDFTGEYNALIVVQKDKPGVVAHISKILSDRGVNIAFMRLFREERDIRLIPSWSRTSACPRVWISCCWQTRTSTM